MTVPAFVNEDGTLDYHPWLMRWFIGVTKVRIAAIDREIKRELQQKRSHLTVMQGNADRMEKRLSRHRHLL